MKKKITILVSAICLIILILTMLKQMPCQIKQYPTLKDAIADGNIPATKTMIAKGAKVQMDQNKGMGPLHCAALIDNLELVQLLLDHGADVHANTGERGYTPLHIAAEKGSIEIAAVLLKHGADVNEQSKPTFDCYELKETPLMVAAHNGKISMVTFLVNHNAQINISDSFGNTALHNAVFSDSKEIVEFLLSSGADANTFSYDSHLRYVDCPILATRENINTDILELLLVAGADINACTYEGETLITLAIQDANKERLTYLLKKERELMLVLMICNALPKQEILKLHSYYWTKA